MTNARVFISCGQKSKNEKQLGQYCSDYLMKKEFLPYFAEDVQSLEALTDSIFNHLRNSEYAIFIDCKREKIGYTKFRGSLFVNQELAIASFLPIEDSIVFHENGVIREGVANYLLAKPILFNDKNDFKKKLKTATKKWQKDWTNELVLNYLRCVPNTKNEYGQFIDWYHLQLLNNHHSKYARDCFVYLSKIQNIDTKKEIQTDNFELVWSGTGLFSRHILPKKTAEIDAFFIVRGKNVIEFHCRPSTSSAYGLPELPSGNYLLTYLVISENFQPVEKTFKLGFGGTFKSISFD